MTDIDLQAAEQLCRSLGPRNCWTGTGGTLASFALAMIRELKERTMKTTDGGTVRFQTGAVRSSDAEATRYDLISPIGLEAVARTCAEGAAKYSDFNWEAGMPVHDLLNHALRHIYRHLAGDRSEEHLAHAAWGLLAAIHSEALWPELNQGTLRGPGCRPPLDGSGQGEPGGT
jgi:hypothetical protein